MGSKEGEKHPLGQHETRHRAAAAQAQFARQSRNYGRSHILADVSDVVAALEKITLPPRARVLDVAAGAGHTGLHLASLGQEVTLSGIALPISRAA